jgi:hypothetical protein
VFRTFLCRASAEPAVSAKHDNYICPFVNHSHHLTPSGSVKQAIAQACHECQDVSCQDVSCHISFLVISLRASTQYTGHSADRTFSSNFSNKHVPEGRNICVSADKSSSRFISLNNCQLEYHCTVELSEGWCEFQQTQSGFRESKLI